MKKLVFLAPLVILPLLAVPVAADFIYTVDSGVWEGTVLDKTDTHVRLELRDGSIITINRDRIKEIEYTAEEEAKEILSRIGELEREAESAYAGEEWEKALALYRDMESSAGEIREEAGTLYEEAVVIKERTRLKIRDIRQAIEEGGIFIEDEANPEDVLKQRGISFTEQEFIKAAAGGETEVLSLFLSAGMDVDATDETGRTALMEACLHANMEAVEQLLEAGADVSLRDNNNRSAFQAAYESGDSELIEKMVGIVDAFHGD